MSEEECVEYIEYYVNGFVEEYGSECLVAYASYIDCIVATGECVDDEELYSEECGAEYDAFYDCLDQ